MDDPLNVSLSVSLNFFFVFHLNSMKIDEVVGCSYLCVLDKDFLNQNEIYIFSEKKKQMIMP